MPRKPAPTVQLRSTVPVVTAERLQKMADAMGTTVPNLVRFMISAQLVQWEAMYLHPERFADVAGNAAGSAAGALADQMASEVAELATVDAPRHDPPGFRPGGKPRSDLELVAASAPGSEWSGYLRGL